MSRRRVVLSVATGVVVLGGAGAFAMAQAGEQPPALVHSAAHYTAPTGDRGGSFTFTTGVTASSGLKSLKVLAWPADSTLGKKGPTAREMTQVDSATCRPAPDDTARCTYTTPVDRADVAMSPHGTWHIAVLASAKNGTTTFDAKVTDFKVG
ncbi:DUF5707 domain-containing protein [Streptomyces sp. NPDC057616]|uniref:DUF5707 domain-containing protein n=1 Tax=Streptomyces sp. NPDC057616 TaxID=3346183 RepID=UPI003678A481